MTDVSAPTPAPPGPAPNPVSAGAHGVRSAGNLWTDVGPVLCFVIVYNLVRQMPEGGAALSRGNAIYWATGVFMAGVSAAISWTLFKGRRLPPMLMITGAVVLVFGTLTIWLHDPKFAYYKPTIINLLFAGVILGSLAIGRNIWKTAFEHVFNLPERAWKVFALRWAGLYLFLAGLNEAIWRTQSEDFWSNSKLFLTIPVVFVFMLANLPFIMKHQIEPVAEPAPADKIPADKIPAGEIPADKISAAKIAAAKIPADTTKGG